MKRLIIFMDDAAPKASQTYRFFLGDDLDDDLLAQLGVTTKMLTPRVGTGYNFSVRSCGKTYRGYISTQGDFVVHIRRQPL